MTILQRSASSAPNLASISSVEHARCVRRPVAGIFVAGMCVRDGATATAALAT